MKSEPQVEIPHVVKESEVRIGSLVLRVLQLSDGQRVIPSEDIGKFCDWLGTEELSDADYVGLEELRATLEKKP